VDAGASVRVDAWVWGVRLFTTRSAAAAACRAGHVRVNDERAKPATPVRVGDTVAVHLPARDVVYEVTGLLTKRSSAPIAAQHYVDRSPPPPPRELAAPAGQRERGAGRPTKRERREIDRLRGRL
jgi:ribosome-associated heat shock protein Hsp15